MGIKPGEPLEPEAAVELQTELKKRGISKEALEQMIKDLEPRAHQYFLEIYHNPPEWAVLQASASDLEELILFRLIKKRVIGEY